LKGTIQILKLIKKRKKAHHRELKTTFSYKTLNIRLNQLLKLNLIEHHFFKGKKREEWYELTERGKKIVLILEKMDDIIV